MRLLEVNNLRTSFRDKDGNYIPAVDGITFHVDQGETLGIVGESGCGKSVAMMSVMRLLDIPPARVEAESVKLLGQDLLSQSEKAMQGIRGNLMSMIFQEPMTSLNPVFTIGDQIAETLELHQKLRKPAALARAIDLLRKVGIPSAERRALDYPHQLSGGMRQRVMIAMALACTPRLLIADEPTTALDVTIQAQILDLIRDLRQELGMSIVLVTHDLGVVAETADRVVVMYAGKIVEEASAVDLFECPKHPYTEGLLNSIPRLDKRSDRLHVIKGVVPHPMHMPLGCRFNPRCPYAQERCYTESPLEVDIGDGHRVSCWYPLPDKTFGEVSA
ncbi:MAG: Oligopeptide transport ATP-binding protein OppD [Firmicutes bacterium]|nr:Oligopeptide transport ATP-binding protein OppD [Bacillota bacterium]